MVGLSPDPKMVRTMALSWGVEPIEVDMYSSTDEMVWFAVETALEHGAIDHGDTVLVLAGAPTGARDTHGTPEPLERGDRRAQARLRRLSDERNRRAAAAAIADIVSVPSTPWMPYSQPLAIVPEPRATVPMAFDAAIVVPRAAGIASVTSDSDVTNANSNPHRNSRRPIDADPQGRRRPTPSPPDPTTSSTIPAIVLAELADPVGEPGRADRGEQFDRPERHRHRTQPARRHTECVVEPAARDGEHREPGQRRAAPSRRSRPTQRE